MSTPWCSHSCERVIRIFPNRASALRLLFALLLHQQREQWTTSHRYFAMTAYGQWHQTRTQHHTSREVTMQPA